MDLATFQQCQSRVGWLPVEVPSQSDPDIRYTVMLSPLGSSVDEADNEGICECPGYLYRSECAHQALAKQLWCGWSEMGIRAIQQNKAQRSTMTCPHCGEGTEWAFRALREDDIARNRD